MPVVATGCVFYASCFVQSGALKTLSRFVQRLPPLERASRHAAPPWIAQVLLLLRCVLASCLKINATKQDRRAFAKYVPLLCSCSIIPRTYT